MSLIKWLVPVVLAVAVAACGSSPTGPSHYAPYSQADLRLGTGATAESGTNVTVTYTGWLYDSSKPEQKGLLFDSSLGRPIAFTFPLGTGSVIAGWERGLVGMQVGGLRRLVVPPSLAYGETRNGIVPPNATLVFDIELTDVQVPEVP